MVLTAFNRYKNKGHEQALGFARQEARTAAEKATKQARDIDRLKVENTLLQQQLREKAEQATKLRAELVKQTEESGKDKRKLRKTSKELEKWNLWWGWVTAHSRRPTVTWLSRLWKRGPPVSSDSGWGGGQ